ncbi:MAG: MotA/TolQ/ExbB proton channel family protein [Proteobacteria bacterium]|nr:MotA/TolQ/ExbB proton channel family protein [Pseudomonadota bacterium]
MLDFIAEKFEQGGHEIMSSISFVAVLSIGLIIERSYRYWLQYDLANSSGFMAAVQKMVMNNSIENAIRLCKKARPKLLPYVMSEGLKRANDSTEEIENALNTATLTAMPKLTQVLPFLGTTANVATLLGLLGTLFGLMKSFGAAAKLTGSAKQTALAAGISEALTATSFGLGTALVCLLAYGILVLKQSAIVDDINRNSARLIDLLYTRKMKIKGGGSSSSSSASAD